MANILLINLTKLIGTFPVMNSILFPKPLLNAINGYKLTVQSAVSGEKYNYVRVIFQNQLCIICMAFFDNLH